MNIALCSHCDFLGNSALHVYAIALALRDRGHDCIMLMPGNIETAPPDSLIRIESFETARNLDLVFDNRKGADIVHAWTPRAHVVSLVRHLIETSSARLIVHMEDNESIIVSRELPAGVDLETLMSWPADLVERVVDNPARTNVSVENSFLIEADGYSCLTDRLLEFAPDFIPSCVIAPGFDPLFVSPRDRHLDRMALGINDDRIVVTYCGNIHASNLADMRSFYAGLALAGRRRGNAITLLRTGWDQVPLELDETTGLEIRNFGFVARDRLPVLISAADLLVQPGRVDEFNAYRFPSKVPDFLVSGRPVILPDTCIGERLSNGVEAIKLSNGDAFDIATCIDKLADDPLLRSSVGSAGRSFALKTLSWSRAAQTLDALYKDVLSRTTRNGRTASVKGQFPVALVALVAEGAELDAAQRAYTREMGVKFILPLRTSSIQERREGPFSEITVQAARTLWEESRASVGPGGDYMVCAAQHIARADGLEDSVVYVVAPDVALKHASVAAYAQWMRFGVSQAFLRPACHRFVFIAGLDPIIQDAWAGGQRSQAILQAGRAALVHGVSDCLRQRTLQDEADFLAATVYRAHSK